MNFLFGKSPKTKPKSPLNEEYHPKNALKDIKTYFNTQVKSGAIDDIPYLDNLVVQKDPHTNTAKIQFEEALRADGIVIRSLERKTDYVMARGTTCAIMPTYDDYDDEEAKRKEIDRLRKKSKYKEAKKKVYKANQRLNIDFFIRASYINAKGYGRSAILKDGDYGDGTPQYLTILYPRLLGNVYIDNNTKQIKYVEYNTDSTKSENKKYFYEPEDLIYFTNRDIGISSNTIGYGYSEIEPIKDVSETSRFYDEAALKENAQAGFAGYPILKFPNLNNKAEIEEILNSLEPARPTAINNDVTIDKFEIDPKTAEIIEARNQNDRRILRADGMPSFTLGFEDVTNRATVSWIMNAWKESFIEQERKWIKRIIERDWLTPLWAKALGRDIEDIYEEEAMITLEFIEYDFDPKTLKIATWLPVWQEGLISNVQFFEKSGETDLALQQKEVKFKELPDPNADPFKGNKSRTKMPADSKEDGGFGQDSSKDDVSTNL